MQMENSPNTTILKFALGGHNKKIHTHPVSPFLKKKKKRGINMTSMSLMNIKCE